MMGICEGRTVVVTGAGGGLGRGYALALAETGAAVVVNDINRDAASQCVEEIQENEGLALASFDDITDSRSAAKIVQTAVDHFGDLHAIVNNAGICRDRMFVSMSEEHWDEVIRIHLKGHFCLSSQACQYWRGRVKETGDRVDARIVNTSSGAGLLGSIGQSNYSAAKGGIATLTLVQAAELSRYGITANALAPSARTSMTTQVPEFAERMKKPVDGSFDYFSPDNIAPLVVWLASPLSAHISGRVFELEGGRISLVDAWRAGPVIDKEQRWLSTELTEVVDRLVEKTVPPQKVYGS